MSSQSIDMSEDVINPLSVFAVPIAIVILSIMLVLAIVGIVRIRLMSETKKLPSTLNLFSLGAITLSLSMVGLLGIFGGFKRIF